MAKDKIHTPVKEALIDEGWLITDDPLRASFHNHFGRGAYQFNFI